MLIGRNDASSDRMSYQNLVFRGGKKEKNGIGKQGLPDWEGGSRGLFACEALFIETSIS